MQLALVLATAIPLLAGCGKSGAGAGPGAGGAGGEPSSTGGSGGAPAGGGGTGGAAGAGGGSGAGGSGVTVPSGPYPSQACLDRANGLLMTMTLDEKLAQTLQLERAQLTPQQVTQYGIGSVYSQGGSAPLDNSPTGWADMTDAYRQAALASRLRIPIIYGLDAVHGVANVRGAVVLPHNGALGATRDPALVERLAGQTATEMNGCGLDFTFAPVIAVARDERWGRADESFGETTELVSMMGAALVRGLQFLPGGGATGVIGAAKHYVGDGGTPMGRDGGDTTGDEAALRALYLEPYRAAIASHLGSVMVSYNSWQGTKMHINRTMVTDVLKGELGFGGFVASDYNGCYQVMLTPRDGLAACLNAGVDMFMLFGSGINGSPPAATVLVDTLALLRGLVQDGTVSQARIDDAARRIVAVKCEMGLFDRPALVDRAVTAQVGSAAHRELARQAVQKSVVVLKNDGGVLPLSKTAIVALAGNSADNTGNQSGGWTISWQGGTGNVVPGATGLRQALEGVLGTANVAYSLDGSSRQGATVGVAVIGETPYAEGRGDRTDLTIPAGPLTAPEASAVMALKQAGLPVVVVLVAGRPLILDPILAYADAIVMAWLPGTEGAGVTDVLFGDVHPSGKLPHSWPRSMAQIPINQGDSTYDPLYPYGHGLTY